MNVPGKKLENVHTLYTGKTRKKPANWSSLFLGKSTTHSPTGWPLNEPCSISKTSVEETHWGKKKKKNLQKSGHLYSAVQWIQQWAPVQSSCADYPRGKRVVCRHNVPELRRCRNACSVLQARHLCHQATAVQPGEPVIRLPSTEGNKNPISTVSKIYPKVFFGQLGCADSSASSLSFWESGFRDRYLQGCMWDEPWAGVPHLPALEWSIHVTALFRSQGCGNADAEASQTGIFKGRL